MIVLIVPVSLQILSRYTGLIPRFIWTEEIARFCFVWIILIGSFLIWGYDFGVLGSRQQSEISGLPMLAIYIAWPIAGASWMIFTLEKIVDDINSYRSGSLHGAS